MKIALIPPTKLLGLSKQTHFHLILSHWCQQDHDYASIYKVWSMHGHHIILDNGAYELGQSVDMSSLETVARFIRPTEIVLPDKLKDRHATIQMIGDSWPTFDSLQQDCGSKAMVVLQGTTDEELIECFEEMHTCWNHFIGSYGIPKHAGRGRLSGRCELLSKLMKSPKWNAELEFHMLGTATVNEVLLVANAFPWVRSIDSSLPFVYAFHGKALHPLLQGDKLYHRPENFTELTHEAFDMELLLYNIKTYVLWSQRP